MQFEWDPGKAARNPHRYGDVDMRVEQLQIEVDALPQSDSVRLRKWIIDKDWENGIGSWNRMLQQGDWISWLMR